MTAPAKTAGAITAAAATATSTGPAPGPAPSDAPVTERPRARPSRLTRLVRRPEFGSLIGTLVVFGFFAVVAGSSGFLSMEGTANWLNTTAELGIIAVPLSLLMIAGEMDLSIGALVGTSSIIVAGGSSFYGVPIWLTIVISLAVGVLVGLVNGYVTIKTRLPAFIVTLGTWFVLAGAGLGASRSLTGTSTITLTEVSPSAKAVFASKLNGFNVSILWWVVITIVASVVLLRTRFGNWAQATGGDQDAARAAGVPTNRVKIALFVATSVGASLVGVIQTVEFNTGNATNGAGFIFNAMIAVIVGGVLLTGGYGSPLGVALGCVTYGVVSLGIFYTGWNTDYAQLFLGALLLVAVLANNYLRRLALTAR